VHQIVLRGDAPLLAARYPSAGGDGGTIETETFLAAVRDHRDEVVAALGRTVQTNEVGRCAALVPAFAQVSRSTGLPLHMLEIGASAGLLSNWDRYWYDCFGSTTGDPSSPVRFTDRWAHPFDLSGITAVVSRAACDIAPLDALDRESRLRLLSFVWPDQRARFEQLTSALAVAAHHPPAVDPADAAEWLAVQLAQRPEHAVTVVFHSIVWQYLPRATKEHMRALLHEHGAEATTSRPLAWVRMEPAGSVADVRVTLWPDADERVIATTSYHGADVRSGQDR